MDDAWNMIEDIIDSDIAYEEFRSRTKRFMAKNSISTHGLSVETGLSRPILTAFLHDGYRRLSFRTLSKLINFMEDYKVPVREIAPRPKDPEPVPKKTLNLINPKWDLL